jgi:hypothetical protein
VCSFECANPVVVREKVVVTGSIVAVTFFVEVTIIHVYGVSGE